MGELAKLPRIIGVKDGKPADITRVRPTRRMTCGADRPAVGRDASALGFQRPWRVGCISCDGEWAPKLFAPVRSKRQTLAGDYATAWSPRQNFLPLHNRDLPRSPALWGRKIRLCRWLGRCFRGMLRVAGSSVCPLVRSRAIKDAMIHRRADLFANLRRVLEFFESKEVRRCGKRRPAPYG